MTKKSKLEPIKFHNVDVTLCENGWLLRTDISLGTIPRMYVAKSPKEIGELIAKYGAKPEIKP